MAEEINVGMKCIKYMLFVANFMFVMIGFLLISIGSTIKAIYGDFEEFMADHYFSPATLAVAIGVIIFFVALFGCVGAIKESTCLINLFGFFLAMLLILEIATAAAAYAMRNNIEATIRDKMELSIKDYPNYYEKGVWDFTQERLFCCGIDEFSDWDKYYPQTTTEIISSTTVEGSTTVGTTNFTQTTFWNGPASCCRRRDRPNGKCYTKSLFRDGCLDALTYIVSESALLLGCGALAIAFIQLLGIIFAWMLAKAVRGLKTQDLIDREQDRQQAYEKFAREKEEKLEKQTPVLYTPTYSEA